MLPPPTQFLLLPFLPFLPYTQRECCRGRRLLSPRSYRGDRLLEEPVAADGGDTALGARVSAVVDIRPGK